MPKDKSEKPKTTTSKNDKGSTSKKTPEKINLSVEKQSNEIKCLISKETYNTLTTNLSALFLYNDTIALIKKDETFQNVIGDYLDAVYTYEEQVKNKDEQLDTLLVAYKTIIGKPYDPNILSKNKIENLDDKISFLEVYLRNTLKIELNDIINKFKKEDKKIDPDTLVNISVAAGAAAFGDNQNKNNNNSTNDSNSQQQSSGQFNSEEFLRKNNVDFDQMADQTILTYSRTLLYSKVLKNEFYVFDSKPSFFVWVKWLYLFGIILFGLTLFATFILSNIPMNKDAIFVFNTDIPQIGDPTELTKWFLSNSNILFSSLVGNDIFTLILTIIMIVIIGMNTINNGIKEIKNRNNDNYRYSCSFSSVVYLIFGLLLLCLLPLIRNTNIHPLTWMQKVLANPDFVVAAPIKIALTTDKVADIYVNNAASFSQMLAMSILQISLLSFSGVAVISSISIKLIAPKKNYESIKNALLQIGDDIKNNRINLQNIQSPASPYQMRFNDMRRFL